MDSSLTIEALLSSNQKEFIELIYPDHSLTREKVTLIIGKICYY